MTGYLTTNTNKPYFVFDDLHSDDDVNMALYEFRTVLRPLMRRNETGGTDQKNANACFLTDVYQNYAASPCFNVTRKYCDPSFVNDLGKHHWLFQALQQHPMSENMQYIYYEQSDNYGAHYDSTLFTFLWWMAPEPIVGGDLILDGKDKIDFRHNRVVLFPLQMQHEVTPVTCDGEGRYCVSNFINMTEQ